MVHNNLVYYNTWQKPGKELMLRHPSVMPRACRQTALQMLALYMLHRSVLTLCKNLHHMLITLRCTSYTGGWVSCNAMHDLPTCEQPPSITWQDVDYDQQARFNPSPVSTCIPSSLHAQFYPLDAHSRGERLANRNSAPNPQWECPIPCLQRP